MSSNSNSNSNNIPTESSTQILNSHHTDYVHHVAFDVYGRRMATCSGDRFVRIWNLGSDNNWELSAEFQAHRGAVQHLDWCHAEFGTLVATCGNDYDVKIWEERNSTNGSSSMSGGGKGGNNVWTCKANLTDARRHVTALEFAPRHLGLQLATTSADGICRIYEAVDLQNLSQWPLQGSIQVGGASAAAADGKIITSLSWCTSRFEPPTLVLGTSTQSSLWRYNASGSVRQWTLLLSFPKHAGPVLDVAWAPNVGRSFHWIASAENGGPLRVYTLKRGENNALELTNTQVLSQGGTWKCQWNITGTVLATSGDAGMVQLWKSDMEGQWKCVSQVYGDMEGQARLD
jgi:nucleoporin SEH1